MNIGNRRTSLRLSQKALILVAVPLIFEFVFVGTLVFLLQRAEFEARKEAHLKAVVAESYSILNGYLNSAMSIYLYKATQQRAFKQQYEELMETLPLKLNSLKLLLRDSPKEGEALARIEEITNRGTSLMDRTLSLIDESAQAEGYLNLKSEVEAVSVELLTELRTFVKDQEKQEDVDPLAESRARFLVQVCIGVGLMMNVVLAVSLALYFNRGTSRRLDIVIGNTRQLAEGKALSVPLDGGDEIALLDRTFHDMADALSLAAKRKQELISIVSHELRTPLTSVQAALTMFSHGLMGELSPKANQTIASAERNVTRLIKLINDLLDVERMESGKISLNPTTVAMDEVLDRSLNAVAHMAIEQDVDIDVPATKLFAFGDEERLVQVVVNLLSNAVKFSPPSGTIAVEVEQIGKEIEVRIIDQGRGVPAEHRQSIFERYVQVESNDGKKGTGLGLPICKAIIEGHGGTIGVVSENGRGSTFWFRIPAFESAEPTQVSLQ